MNIKDIIEEYIDGKLEEFKVFCETMDFNNGCDRCKELWNKKAKKADKLATILAERIDWWKSDRQKQHDN